MGRIVILARSNDIQCEMESAIQTLDDIANKIDVLTVEQLGLVSDVVCTIAVCYFRLD